MIINEQEILNSNILIVDDQEFNLLLMEQILRDIGYVSITGTMNPSEVCKLYRKNQYDLILLDLLMPDMDGFKVMEGLNKIEKNGYLPVLVITALPEHKLRALAAGAQDFISKPFDIIEVRTRIHNMLEVRLLHMHLDKLNKVLEHYNQVLGQTVLERADQLRESEERFRCLIALSSDWYWEQDENGKFTKIFGPANEPLDSLADSKQDKTREDQGARWNVAKRESLVEDSTAQRAFLDSVYSRTNPDGSRQYLMLSGEPKFDLAGGFTGYRGIGKDVTTTMQHHLKTAADNLKKT